VYDIILKKGAEREILRGEKSIVYANEVLRIDGKGEQGAAGVVHDIDGRFVAKGFVNHASKMLVRVLTREPHENINGDFFKERIIKAYNFRKIFFGEKDSYRAVFSDSDDLSGLIVDRYYDVTENKVLLSIQILSKGFDAIKGELIKILAEVFSASTIVERSDSDVRVKEGLQEFKGIIYGENTSVVTVIENGVTLSVDLLSGQKTGYFLDQKQNRFLILKYAKGKRVLDLFCNQGGFALNALKGGAAFATAVDISKEATDKALANFTANGFTAKKCEVVTENVFDFLNAANKDAKRYDLIILDPPAFIKSADKIKEGMSGYADINSRAMRLLNDGGVLLTCSCSKHLTVSLFMDMLKDASVRAKTPIRLLSLPIQSPDHAPKITEENALYLKLALLMKY
jgi:23S rRNA (cytosine1962-C5)-methyltransferase